MFVLSAANANAAQAVLPFASDHMPQGRHIKAVIRADRSEVWGKGGEEFLPAICRILVFKAVGQKRPFLPMLSKVLKALCCQF